MPKTIARAYDEDKILSLIVRSFDGPTDDKNSGARAEMRSAMELELRKAVSIGDGHKIAALREALQDI
jgi:hypothetical protein